MHGSLSLEGVVRCEQFPGEEQRHSPCRHCRGFENFRKQTPAAALLQSAHQDRYDQRLQTVIGTIKCICVWFLCGFTLP